MTTHLSTCVYMSTSQMTTELHTVRHISHNINNNAFLPELVGCQVATEAVGADTEEDAKQQRQRVEDVDNASHVRDGEQQRASNHHLYWPRRDDHHVFTHTHTLQ